MGSAFLGTVLRHDSNDNSNVIFRFLFCPVLPMGRINLLNPGNSLAAYCVASDASCF